MKSSKKQDLSPEGEVLAAEIFSARFNSIANWVREQVGDGVDIGVYGNGCKLILCVEDYPEGEVWFDARTGHIRLYFQWNTAALIEAELSVSTLDIECWLGVFYTPALFEIQPKLLSVHHSLDEGKAVCDENAEIKIDWAYDEPLMVASKPEGKKPMWEIKPVYFLRSSESPKE